MDLEVPRSIRGGGTTFPVENAEFLRALVSSRADECYSGRHRVATEINVGMSGIEVM